MTADTIHDLLDAISAGQPVVHRLSVDDLVRAGRRRRRTAAAGVASGTAAVVVVAGAAFLPRTPESHPGPVAAPSTAPSPSDGQTATPSAGPSVPALAPSPVVATVTAPLARATDSAATLPAGWHLVPISNLNILDHQTTMWTQVYAHHCVSFPTLTVQETATEVRLSLYLTSPANAASVAAHDEYPLCSQDEVPTGPNGGGYPLYDGSTTARLDVPVGARRVVDAATGKTIPYADQDRAAVPTWLPPGFQRVGAIEPGGPNGWSQTWEIPHPKSAIVWQQLNYFEDGTSTPRTLPTTNTTVNGHPAWLYQTNKSEVDLQWTANGVWYELDESSTTDGCPGMVTIPPDAECNQGAKVTAAVTKAELLRIARSFAVPSS